MRAERSHDTTAQTSKELPQTGSGKILDTRIKSNSLGNTIWEFTSNMPDTLHKTSQCVQVVDTLTAIAAYEGTAVTVPDQLRRSSTARHLDRETVLAKVDAFNESEEKDGIFPGLPDIPTVRAHMVEKFAGE